MARKSVFAHAYAVVMAGGSGTRFWPLSRRKHPKQLLELFGHGTLLEQTVERLRPIIPPERIYVYTNELVWREVRRRLPQIPRAQIVAEPASRNTAPTLGVAAHEICRRDPQGLMVVLPADHIISKPAEFLRVLRAGCETAEKEGRSVVIGLKPTRPDTGFGYVRVGAREARIAGPRDLPGGEVHGKAARSPSPAVTSPPGVICGTAACSSGELPPCSKISPSISPKMADQLAQLGRGRRGAVAKNLSPPLPAIREDFH